MQTTFRWSLQAIIYLSQALGQKQSMFSQKFLTILQHWSRFHKTSQGLGQNQKTTVEVAEGAYTKYHLHTPGLNIDVHRGFRG